MPTYSEIRDRYRDVSDRVAAAAERSGRHADDILIVAVTKLATPDQIRQLIELGHVDLGENRVQQLTQRVAMSEEFLARHRTMTSSRAADVPEHVRWHMIGSLQRNKVKGVLPLVKLIHSVDSLRLAEEVQSQAERQDREAEVLIQVNPVGEKTKHGIAPAAAPHLIDQMQTMFNVRVRGLMMIAPLTDDEDRVRLSFERTAETFEDIRSSNIAGERFNILSMGMTSDYEMAVEHGANVVRLGRALFGEPVEAAAG